MHCYKIDPWDHTILMAFHGTGKKILTHNGCKNKTSIQAPHYHIHPEWDMVRRPIPLGWLMWWHRWWGYLQLIGLLSPFHLVLYRKETINFWGSSAYFHQATTWLSLFESDFCQYWQACIWYIDNCKSCRWKPGNPAEILKHELVLKTTLIVIMTPHQTHIRCRGHPINGTALPQACDVMWRPRVFKMRLVIFLLAHVSSPKSWWSCTPTSKKKNCKPIINSVSKFQKASWLGKWHHLCKFVNILAWKTNQIGNMKTAKP